MRELIMAEQLRVERHLASVSPSFAFHLVLWMLSASFLEEVDAGHGHEIPAERLREETLAGVR